MAEYKPKASQILDKAPKFNTFYRPERTRNVYLSQVARVAAKNAGLPDNMTFPTVKAIAASQWNKSHIAYTSKGYENYGIQGPAYNKIYGADPLSQPQTGNEYPVIWIPDPRNPQEPKQFFGVDVHIDKPTKPIEVTKPTEPIVGPIVSPELPEIPEPEKKPDIIIIEPIDTDGNGLIDDISITDEGGDSLIPGEELEISDGEITIPETVIPGGKKIIVRGLSKKQLAAYKKKLKAEMNRYVDKRIDARLAALQQKKPTKQKGDLSWAAVPLFSLVALL